MNHNTRHLPQAPIGRVRQTGVATLMMSAVLLLLLTILSFTAARVGIQQQRLAGTDMRTREVREASEAGLEYALAWLRDNKCNYASCGDPGVCTDNCFPTLPAVTLSSGYSYTPAVSFSIQPGGLLLVASTAVATQDSDITNTVQQVIKQTDLLSPRGRAAPPIVVDGCAAGHTGTPDLFPRPGGKAILSLDLKGQSLNDCLDPGHFDIVLCEDQQNQDILCTADAGNRHHVSNPLDYLGDDSANRPPNEPAAWNYMFEYDLADAKADAIAAGQVYATDSAMPAGDARDVPYYIYNTSSPFNRNGDTIGSPNHPVIIIIPAAHGCPSFNGGSDIYGFVYFENQVACLNQGWGGTEVHGSVVFEGDGNKFNSNTNLFDQGVLDGGGDDDTTVFLDDAARALGAWKDW